MNLYLVQHGQSVPEEVDRERPLSDQGWEDIRKTAAFAARAGVRVDTIWHSAKTRARQTAQALAQALEPRRGPEEAEGLKPLDDPSIWAKRVSDLQHDTIFVGHLPHLSRAGQSAPYRERCNRDHQLSDGGDRLPGPGGSWLLVFALDGDSPDTRIRALGCRNAFDGDIDSPLHVTALA